MGIFFSPFVIPVVFFVCACIVSIIAMVLSSRAKERLHKERMYLLEKGMEIPPELYDTRKPETKERRNGYRAGRVWLIILGLLFTFIGISVVIMPLVQGQGGNAAGGLVPIGIGAAFLVAERIIARIVAQPEQ